VNNKQAGWEIIYNFDGKDGDGDAWRCLDCRLKAQINSCGYEFMRVGSMMMSDIVQI